MSLRPVVERLLRVVKAHGRDRHDLADARQDAWLGAIAAVDKHQPASGASLETYAAHRIRGAILDGRRRRDQTRYGRHGSELRVELVPLDAVTDSPTGRTPLARLRLVGALALVATSLLIGTPASAAGPCTVDVSGTGTVVSLSCPGGLPAGFSTLQPYGLSTHTREVCDWPELTAEDFCNPVLTGTSAVWTLGYDARPGGTTGVPATEPWYVTDDPGGNSEAAGYAVTLAAAPAGASGGADDLLTALRNGFQPEATTMALGFGAVVIGLALFMSPELLSFGKRTYARARG